jgi:Flp pilus assembly protein TadB
MGRTNKLNEEGTLRERLEICQHAKGKRRLLSKLFLTGRRPLVVVVVVIVVVGVAAVVVVVVVVVVIVVVVLVLVVIVEW